MNNTYRYPFLVVIGLLVAVSLFFAWRWRMAEASASAASNSKVAHEMDLNMATTQLADLKSEKDRLQSTIAQLQAKLLEVESGTTILLSEPNVADLKGLGLKEPAADLMADLSKHKDLISFEGLSGGIMRFGNAFLITPRWVVVSFGDGHRSGVGIYKYEVRNGQIRWKALDAYVQGLP